MNNKSGIYKITNTVNSKFYIGSSKHLESRWTQHNRKLLTNNHINPKLQHAWNYHGKDAFEFSIIEECEESKLFEREQFYLDTFKPYTQGIGYNIAKNASGGDTLENHPRGDEIKEGYRVKYSGMYSGGGNPMFGKSHSSSSIDLQKAAAVGRFSLEWFIDRNGIDVGTEKYNRRVEKLKNRKINYVHNNGRTGMKLGEPSQHIKDKISSNKAAFKLRKSEFMSDLKLDRFTIKALAEKYSISTTNVKYHKRKLASEV